MHYQKNMEHEVCTIAHSCGVNDPRELRRQHGRVIGANGLSVGLEQLFPEPVVPLTQA